jgi:hypothetical protein
MVPNPNPPSTALAGWASNNPAAHLVIYDELARQLL